MVLLNFACPAVSLAAEGGRRITEGYGLNFPNIHFESYEDGTQLSFRICYSYV